MREFESQIDSKNLRESLARSGGVTACPGRTSAGVGHDQGTALSSLHCERIDVMRGERTGCGVTWAKSGDIPGQTVARVGPAFWSVCS